MTHEIPLVVKGQHYTDLHQPCWELNKELLYLDRCPVLTHVHTKHSRIICATFHHWVSFPSGNTAEFLRAEEAIPELEIDVDELLDMEDDVDRAARVKELLVDCYKPTEEFVAELLDRIRGMQKLSTPQKK
uniref:Protein phosphatase 1, regulatory (inhibitor) subunit 14Bb n=1 Tax=Cyprinus carpio carpio TaxID=630221 RepID=A0A9J7YML2_CYPCA